MTQNKDLTIHYSLLLRFTFISILSGVFSVYAQNSKTVPDNWHLLDYEKDGVYGISMEKAYLELLNGKEPDTVIVAIIDSGIDTLHADLRGVLWRNTAEQGNDEDNNGYVGDQYGWNFLGGKGGKSLGIVPLEFMRQYFRLRNDYEEKDLGNIPKKQRREYRLWEQVRDKFRGDSLELVSYYQKAYKELQEGDLRIREVLDQQKYTASNLSTLDESQVSKENRMYRKLMSQWTTKNTTNTEILTNWQNQIDKQLKSRFTFSAFSRKANLRQEIIGDDYYNFKDKYYGNPFIQDGVGSHGTLVAGLIGAIRDNSKGVNGVANVVKLMAIKAIPKEGDEYDKDIALAIRYAVDNGAKVINMSFAKDFSPEQIWVEQAINYAKRKDVLLVQAAGNDGRNVDIIPKYPSSKPLNEQKRFPNMINVGASGPTVHNLIADFSNYGQKMVDVFAPGVDIHSTYIGGGCAKRSGTSMASPVVTGIATVLRSYFPDLSALEVKQIIEASVTKISQPVRKPGLKFEDKQKKELVNMTQLCKTGGIVNAYKAIELAISRH